MHLTNWEEANLKKLLTVWFQLCDIPEKAKLSRQQEDKWLPTVEGKNGWVGGTKI